MGLPCGAPWGGASGALPISPIGTAYGYRILTCRLSAFRYVIYHPRRRDNSRLSNSYFWPRPFLIASLQKMQQHAQSLRHTAAYSWLRLKPGEGIGGHAARLYSHRRSCRCPTRNFLCHRWPVGTAGCPARLPAR